jgi:hypothetical protein
VRQRTCSQNSVASTASSQPGTPSNSLKQSLAAGEPIRNHRTIKNDTLARKISFSSSAVATFIFDRVLRSRREREGGPDRRNLFSFRFRSATLKRRHSCCIKSFTGHPATKAQHKLFIPISSFVNRKRQREVSRRS